MKKYLISKKVSKLVFRSEQLPEYCHKHWPRPRLATVHGPRLVGVIQSNYLSFEQKAYVLTVNTIVRKSSYETWMTPFLFVSRALNERVRVWKEEKFLISVLQILNQQYYLQNHTALYEIIKCDSSSALSVKLSYQEVIESIRKSVTWWKKIKIRTVHTNTTAQARTSVK